MNLPENNDRPANDQNTVYRAFSPKIEVSVVIPSADGRRDGNVPRLLDNLKSQSFRNMEVIVIVGVSPQGKAINDNASKDIKVLVVGNPANTNALIAQRNAPDINPRQFTAMTRLDHNRGMAQLATKLGKTVNDIKKMTIWGNHSSTQYPDLHHCEVDGKVAVDQVEQDWYEAGHTVAKRPLDPRLCWKTRSGFERPFFLNCLIY